MSKGEIKYEFSWQIKKGVFEKDLNQFICSNEQNLQESNFKELDNGIKRGNLSDYK